MGAPVLSMTKNMLLSGVPCGWVYKINPADDSKTLLFKFDNLAPGGTIKFPSAGASATGETVDYTRSDGALIKFPKSVPSIDAETENAITDATGGADASGLGEITLVTNEAPMGSTSYTKYIMTLLENKSEKLLIITPTGYSFNRTGTGNQKKADGFAYMLGKLTNDVELPTTNAPVTTTMTFAAQKASDWAPTPATDLVFTTDGITIKRGGSDYVDSAINYPIALTADDLTDLQDGKVVIKETPAS